VYQNSSLDLQLVGKISQKALRTAWIQFLDQWSWSWFISLTFRRSVSVEGAEKAFRFWISKINRELYGSRWARKPHGGIAWCCALEFQRPRDVPHFHCLLANTKGLRRLTWMNVWNDIGGFARIEDIRNRQAVRRYVTKYALKEGDITLGGGLSKSAQVLLSRIPRRIGIPAQPTLPLTTNADAGVQLDAITDLSA